MVTPDMKYCIIGLEKAVFELNFIVHKLEKIGEIDFKISKIPKPFNMELNNPYYHPDCIKLSPILSIIESKNLEEKNDEYLMAMVTTNVGSS